MSAEATTPSERADACLAALDDAGRVTARRVALRLIRFTEGQPDGPRQQPLAALQVGDDPAQLAEILRRLSDAQLLTIDGDPTSGDARVELAQDASIAAWPTLQGWAQTHGQAEQLRRQLETEATGWQQRTTQGLDKLGLLDKGQLTELDGWLTAETRRDLGISEVADSFIAASRAALRPRWWPGKAATGTVLAILLMLLILATPIILLFIVVLTAGVIHRLG